MRKIINKNLARNLRGSLNTHIHHLGNILAELDRREKQEDTKGEESDALIAIYDLNRAVAILIQVDDRLKYLVLDSELFSLPPASIGWLMRLVHRMKG
jgi:hypothetical protein